MANRKIFITENDLHNLIELIVETRRVELRKSEYLLDLEKELSRAEIVPSAKIPADIITMNTTAVLEDLESGEDLTATLVYPQDSDMTSGKISILAPIGTAMIGYRVGDTFEWPVPDGVSVMKVKRIIYQPEASGNYGR